MKLKTLLALLLTLAIIQTSSIQAQTKQIWNWSKPGAHHAAAVKVSSQHGAGSGTLCYKSQSQVIFVSAAHVFGEETTAEVTLQNGQTTQTTIASRDHGLDLAFLVGNLSTDVVPLELSVEVPPVGASVEVLGFGGPSAGFRHFWTTVKDVQADNYYLESYVTEGDSGGCILYRGKIIGTVTGGMTALPTTSGFNLCTPILSSRIKPTMVQCGPSGCSPIMGGWEVPQQQFTQPYCPPQIQPIPQPICPPQVCEIDYDRIASIVIQQIKTDVELQILLKGEDGADGNDGQNGLPGTIGPPGPTGPPCDCEFSGLDWDAIAQKLPPMYFEVLGPEGEVIPIVGEDGTIKGNTAARRLGETLKLQLNLHDVTP